MVGCKCNWCSIYINYSVCFTVNGVNYATKAAMITIMPAAFVVANMAATPLTTAFVAREFYFRQPKSPQVVEKTSSAVVFSFCTLIFNLFRTSLALSELEIS